MKLGIILLIILSIYKVAGNKYCSLESNGEPKYFICARNEYCCHFGCCVHLAFQFYQLWYYWLLLIFMFMLCSGGSWWYKFCRHHERSAYPSIPPNFERQSRQTGIESRRNRSVDRNAADNSYYFQRIWKVNGIGPPPNYYTASVVRYHSASELETRRQQQECPYYQLYGPPPSYESVVRIPENGCGQPSCTLVPATTSHQIEQQEQQQTSSYLADSLGSSGSGVASGSGVGQIVIDTSQHLPSTSSSSIKNDFVAVPLQQHLKTIDHGTHAYSNDSEYSIEDVHTTIIPSSSSSSQKAVSPSITTTTTTTTPTAAVPINMPSSSNSNNSKYLFPTSSRNVDGSRIATNSYITNTYGPTKLTTTSPIAEIILNNDNNSQRRENKKGKIYNDQVLL